MIEFVFYQDETGIHFKKHNVSIEEIDEFFNGENPYFEYHAATIHFLDLAY